MGYDNQTAGQQAQSDAPFFPVGEAVVFERDARPGEHLFSIFEAEAMLGEVLPVLRFRPIRISYPFRLHCNSFCSYMQRE